MNNQRGMAVIFFTALVVCVIMLAILQFGFEMDVYVGLFLAVGAGAVAISYVCIKYMDAGRELQRVEKTINKIISETGAKLDVEEDGRVYIASEDEAAAQKAKAMVESLVKEVEVGETYLGRVTHLMKFGAFVEILPGKEGLVHVSQLALQRVEKPEDIVHEGDEIMVKVTEIDDKGRINLSRKALLLEKKNK